MATFRYDLTMPDPNGERPVDRKQGDVRGFVGHDRGGDEGGVPAQGCATGPVNELRAAHPDFEIVDGYGDNTSDGRQLLASLKSQGKVT
jgi:hypothetical protein